MKEIETPSDAAVTRLQEPVAGGPPPVAKTAYGRAIVVTSGKGGVGKTTTTANLGTALADAGKRVAVVDADVGLRNLDVVLGLENRVNKHLLDVIEKQCTMEEALVRDRVRRTLYLLPAAQSAPSGIASSKTNSEPPRMIDRVMRRSG